MSRQNKISCLIGDRGTGKTPVIIGDSAHGVKSLAAIYVQKGCSVIIVDTVDNKKYQGLVIDLKPTDDLSKLKPAIYRIIMSIDAFQNIVKKFNQGLRNAAIFYEDAFRYVPKMIDTSLVSQLLDSKQKNIDTFFLYHAWGWIPKDLFRVIDDFLIFKSSEHPRVRQAELSGKYEKVLAAWNRAMASPNRYYNELVLD